MKNIIILLLHIFFFPNISVVAMIASAFLKKAVKQFHSIILSSIPIFMLLLRQSICSFLFMLAINCISCAVSASIFAYCVLVNSSHFRIFSKIQLLPRRSFQKSKILLLLPNVRRVGHENCIFV